MKWPGGLAMLTIGIVAALAITWQPTHLDISLAGWMIALGGALGLTIGLIGQRQHALWQAWHTGGPWLVAIGGVGWLSLLGVNFSTIDLPTVGFILFLTGACLSVAAICQVSGWRLTDLLAGAWMSDTAETDTGQYSTSHPIARTEPSRSEPSRSEPSRSEPRALPDDRTQVLPAWRGQESRPGSDNDDTRGGGR